MDVDAVVVGGGISGCASAIELARSGWRVVVLYRRDYVLAIESLAPEAVRQLQALSIETGSALAEVVAWWGSDSEIRASHPGARIVQRTTLARALQSRAIDSGALFVELGRMGGINRSPIGWMLVFDTVAGSTRRISSQYLVDGSGRASTVGRRLGARRLNLDQLFCASVQVSGVALAGIWTESVLDGWWNLVCTPQGDGTLSFYSTAAGVRSAKQDIGAVLRRTRQLRRLLPFTRFGAVTIRVSGSSRLIPCAGDGWLSVGDAASTLQPLTSAGVAKALRDARLIRRFLDYSPQEYDAFQHTEFDSYLRKLREHYKLENRWPKNAPWTMAFAN